MRTSRVLLAGVVAVAGGALAGCEQPTPGITVFSGTDSVRTSALCWSFSEAALGASECARDIISGADIGSAPQLGVSAGNVVGISVDPVIAERGWVPAIAGQQLLTTPITETYFRFTFPSGQLPANGVGLQVIAGESGDLQGIWAVRLVG